MNLTARQSNTLRKASGWVAPSQRAAFIKSIENRLRDRPYITGSELRHNINFVLSSFGVSAPQSDYNNNKEI
jgi:hypothetical protein